MDASALESAISALTSTVSALEKSSEGIEAWLPVCTGIVVIGVAGEIWILCVEHREALAAWRRAAISSPDKPSGRRFIVGLVSAIMVVVGVAGEFGVGIGIARINSSLRDKNAELRGKTEQLVGLLRKEASKANERAANTEKELALLKEPRRLSVKQRRELSSVLSRYAGIRANLSSLEGDDEITDLTSDLQDALGSKGAGWLLTKTPRPPDGVSTSGILVEYSLFNTVPSKPAATLLARTLQHMGLEAVLMESTTNRFPEVFAALHDLSIKHDRDAHVLIVICRKPIKKQTIR